MTKNLAKILSLLLSPAILLIPIPLILVYKTTGDFLVSIEWTVISCFFLLLMIVSVILGNFIGVFSDFDVSVKKERPKLFLLGMLIVFLFLASLIVLNGPKILFAGVYAIIFGVLAMYVLNKWIKVSLHTASMTVFSFTLILIFGRLFIPSLLLVPLVGWARVKIKKHTPREVYAGGFLGAVFTIIVYIAIRLTFFRV